MKNKCISLLFAFLVLPATLLACDLSSFTVNSVADLGGGYYEFNVTFCAGSGQNAYRYGADQNTYTWAIRVDNGAVVTSAPAFLTSPNTGSIYFSDTISYMGYHYLVYDYSSGGNGWWTCIDGGCGPVQSTCIDVTFTTYGMPNTILGGGAESAGIVIAGLGYGCNDEPDMIQHLLVPEAHAGNDTQVCPGGTVTLDAGASDGTPPYTYLWSTGATSSSISVAPAVSTTYSVTVTDGNGNTATDDVTVSIASTPTANAGADKQIYIGYGATCVSLNGSATGGTSPYTYAWSNGSTSAIPSVCPATSTTYTLTVTDANGCASTDAVEVAVENIVCGPGKVYVCHYGTTKCYKTNQVNSHLNHGDYLGTCDGMRLADMDEEPMLSAYPNPACNEVSLLFHLEEETAVTIEFYSMSGQLVARPLMNNLRESGDWLEVIALHDMEPGMYMVRLVSDAGDQYMTSLMISR